MKKIRVILFLMLSICILVSCGNKKPKVKETVKTKSYEEVSEIDFSNTELKKGEKAILLYMENPKKFNLYGYLLEGYTMLFGYDTFYELYSEKFLNNKNKFIHNDEDISSFKLLVANIDGERIKEYKDVLIAELKKEINIKTDTQNKDINNEFRKFISLVEEKINIMEEIKKYYELDEYKKDNFAKGKLLNDKYLINREQTEQKYKEVYNLFFEAEKIVLNNSIIHLELGGLVAKENLLKTRELLKMFSKEFYATKLDFDENMRKKDESVVVIKEEDKENYINNLKRIQKTLDKTILNMEKIDKDTIKKENMNVENYGKVLVEIKEMSKLTKEIITKMEKNDDEELDLLIPKYVYMNFSIEKDFVNLLK